VAFGISAVAAYIVPTTGQLWNVELTNLGTFVGATVLLGGRHPSPARAHRGVACLMIRGRLFPGSSAPVRGEHVEGLARVGNVVIEQILDGVVDEPVDYDQDHDEWVVLLEGAAELEVNGETLRLEQGDWVLLPRQTPHRLMRTTEGTSWLAVRVGVGLGRPPSLA
jgi:cupin 2 domain-containing protein